MNKIFGLVLFCALTANMFAGNSSIHDMIFERDAGVINPESSPDGKYIAFTTPNYQGLFLWSPDNEKIIEISNEPAAGFGFNWSESGHAIIFKPALFMEKRRYNSLVEYAVEAEKLTYLLSDRIYLPGRPKWIGSDGVYLLGNIDQPLITITRSANTAKKNYFNYYSNKIIRVSGAGQMPEVIETTPNPILSLVESPDGKKVAYKEYGGHLFIRDMQNGSTVDLGPGHEAEWSPDGKKLVFMRTYDDGYMITQSDIYVVNGDGTGLLNLTAETDRLAMRPTWFENGKYVIYDTDTDGKLFRVEVK